MKEDPGQFMVETVEDATLTKSEQKEISHIGETVAANALHFSYGVSGGALYAAAASEVRKPRSRRRERSFAHLISAFVSVTAGRANIGGDASGQALTEREREVFRHIALDYSNLEIAEKMNISVKTVEALKANSLKKLNLQSRKDIIRYAILQVWMQEN